MSTEAFDLITIGGGSGGVAASRRAASYGARVALCEADRIGGTCVLRGCVPKKLLVYGAHFRDDFEDAAGFGWTVPPARHDWPALIAAKSRELDRLNGVYQKMLRDSGVSTFYGRAKLIDANTVAVGDQILTARHILIATGSWPLLPELPGIEHAITSNEALDLPELPRRVVVVGGGYIGVEFAGIFHGFGSHVTQLTRDVAPLRGFDLDVRAHLLAQLQKRGIEMHPQTLVERIEKLSDGRRRVHTSRGDKLDADVVLMATGRAPSTRGLGLAEAGVGLDDEGAIVVDEDSRTAVPHIYAVGDCTDRLNLTPVAIAEGRAVAETLFNRNPMRVRHTLVPTAVFSTPPVSTVGMTEEEARAQIGPGAAGGVDVYVSAFRPMKHTLSGRDERTLMKLVVERSTQRVLGCHMVGPDAPEIIQGLAVALTCGATKAQFDATIGIHPTAAEEFVTMREKRKD